jgi:hypothetical protein
VRSYPVESRPDFVILTVAELRARGLDDDDIVELVTFGWRVESLTRRFGDGAEERCLKQPVELVPTDFASSDN